MPLEVFPKALDLIESAFNTTNHLDGLQRTLEYGFYRLVPPLGPLVKENVDPKDFIADDLMLTFRNVMEARGWKFKKLSTVPKVDGSGNVQEHIFKYVSDGTIWTINASILSDGRLYAFGGGFKVLQGYSQGREVQEDDDWTVEDMTQEVGMTVDDFADLVTDTALDTHGQDPDTHEFASPTGYED